MKVLSTKSGETERIFNAAFEASGLIAAILKIVISNFVRHERVIGYSYLAS